MSYHFDPHFDHWFHFSYLSSSFRSFILIIMSLHIAQMDSECPVCLESKELLTLHSPNNIPHKICHKCAEKLEAKEKQPASSVEWIGAHLEPHLVSCPLCRAMVPFLPQPDPNPDCCYCGRRAAPLGSEKWLSMKCNPSCVRKAGTACCMTCFRNKQLYWAPVCTFCGHNHFRSIRVWSGYWTVSNCAIPVIFQPIQEAAHSPSGIHCIFFVVSLWH